ncbi:MAG: VCBS repeat-containing protein, partial [Ekhidna sp.]|nr:VCBS repeat-containing protein [Ekhidna sp.]
ELTVELWANPASVTGSQYLISKWEGKPGSGTAGGFVFWLEGDQIAASSISGNSWVSTDASISSGTWSHFAMVYDGSGANNEERLKIYQNGQPLTINYSTTVPVQLADEGNASVMLGTFVANGTSNTPGGNYFDGELDAVRIWGDVRTQSEIVDNAFSDLSTGDQLVASYSFNQSSGSLLDLTSNDYDGNLFGATYTLSNAFVADVFGPLVVITSSQSGSTSNAPFDVTITFNEPLDPGTFIATDLTVTNGVVANFTETVANQTFTADIYPTSETTVSVDVLAGVAADPSGNPNTASNTFSINTTFPENALSFSGGSDVVAFGDVFDDVIAGADQQFTIEAWINPVNVGVAFQPLVYKYADGSCGASARQLRIELQNDRPTFIYYGALGSGNFAIIQSDIGISASIWTHLAFVYDGTVDTNDLDRVTIYINGAEAPTTLQSSSGTFPRTIQDGPAQFALGKAYNATTVCTSSTSFQGQIDELRVWDGLRTQEQILGNAYNSLLAGPVASYTFNNSSGAAIDAIGTNDGVLEGIVSYVPSNAWATDIFPPAFEATYPQAQNVDFDNLDLVVQLNEAGTAYYVVIPDGAAAPSAAEVLAGTGNGGTGEIRSGNFAVPSIATDASENIAGLSAETDYDIYVVAADDEGTPNTQNAPSLVDVTTGLCPILDETVAATVTNVPVGTGTTVTTGSSVIGVTYFLRDDSDNSIVDTQVGTGSGLVFNTGNLSSNTTFNVYAIQGNSAASYAAAVQNPFRLDTDGNGYNGITFVDFDQDGDKDIFSGRNNNAFTYYENTGTASSPDYDPAAVQNNPFNLVGPASITYLYNDFVDLDNDGDLDMMVTGNGGNFYYYQNIGSASAPDFNNAQPVANPFGLANNGTSYTWGITFADIDDDGDFDMMAGANAIGRVDYYENTGTASSPSFAARASNPFNIDGSSNSYQTPTLVDFDFDGDFDLFYGDAGSSWYYEQNIGTPSSPNFGVREVNPFGLTNIPSSYIQADFVDLDSDGDLDVMSGNSGGTFEYYENVGRVACLLEMTQTVTVTVTSPPPAAPTNLIAYEAAGNITFEWTDNANNETGFLIERADDYAFTTNVTDITVASGSPGVDATTATYDPAGNDYYYRVTAVNGFEDVTSISAVEFASPNPFSGQALRFDGSSHVNLGTGLNPIFDPISTLTLEAWIYPTTSNPNQTIIGNYNNATSMQYLLRYYGNGTLSFFIGTTETTLLGA